MVAIAKVHVLFLLSKPHNLIITYTVEVDLVTRTVVIVHGCSADQSRVSLVGLFVQTSKLQVTCGS